MKRLLTVLIALAILGSAGTLLFATYAKADSISVTSPAASASSSAALLASVHMAASARHRRDYDPVPKRILAFRWAERQRGKAYSWGGTGPWTYDCSGLVMMAYRHVGIKLPRTTWEMMGSRRLVRVRYPRKGDLVFMYGGGHVELFQNWKHLYEVAFGAHDYGSPVGWDHTPRSQWAEFFRVRGAG